MKFKFSIKLATISLIGNIIIAIGVSTCRISQMGIDPFTSMTTGISGLLNIPLGVFQGSINAVLFLVLILLSRSNLKYLNIGAIINMFLLGFFVQFFNNVYCQLFNVSSRCYTIFITNEIRGFSDWYFICYTWMFFIYHIRSWNRML